MKASISSIGKTVKHSMFTQERTKKEDKLLCGISTTVTTRNGKLSILTKLRKSKLKDFMKTMACTATDHSISDQDSQ
jgi:hypothetical protein